MTRNAMTWLFLAMVLLIPAHRAAADSTQSAIAEILHEARAGGCTAPADRLARILCDGVMQIGVRGNYPGFGVQQGGMFSGFDVDVGQAIAHRLGVRMQPVVVTPANRIAMVSDGGVDAIIATLGHSITRDSQIHYVRPHYYASSTAVFGARLLRLPDGAPLAGRTICVPLGAASNVMLAEQGARLMIFDQPQHLLDALRFNRCSLVAHDDTYFADSMTDRSFAARFEQKLSLAAIPWGMAVSRQSGSSRLGRLLALIVTDFHRSGTLIDLAQRDHVPDRFLLEQRAIWSEPSCILPGGDPAVSCMQEPIRDTDEPTRYAARVAAAETWLRDRTGLDLVFPMLKGQKAFALFEEGIVNTLILVFGAIGATLGFALLFQRGLRERRWWFNMPTHWLTTLLQSSPVVLLLILAYFIMTAIVDYGSGVVLTTSIIVIGLSNGSFAGAAIADAARTLTVETGVGDPPFSTILRRSATQVMEFAVNAARASAVASFIGAPELLNVLTDIASVTTERKTTYAILLVFYLAVVMLVVWLAGMVTRRLSPAGTAA